MHVIIERYPGEPPFAETGTDHVMEKRAGAGPRAGETRACVCRRVTLRLGTPRVAKKVMNRRHRLMSSKMC